MCLNGFKSKCIGNCLRVCKNDVERHFQKRDIIVAGNAVQDDFIKNPAPDPNLPMENRISFMLAPYTLGKILKI